MTRRRRKQVALALVGAVLAGGGLLFWGAPRSLVGKPAPDFSLPDQEGTAAHLSDLRGKWVVLVFYPKDGSRGCTRENQACAHELPAFTKRNSEVWAISTGGLSQKRVFCQTNGFQHRLLSDINGAVSLDYRVMLPIPGLPMANRVTVIIDPSGTVVSSEPVFRFADSAAHTLARLDDLQCKVQ